MPPAIDLLQLEIETLWVTDERGRLSRARANHGTPVPHMVIAAAIDGTFVALGSKVPDSLVTELREVLEASEPAQDPATQPPGLARCAALLSDAIGPVDIASGPSYLVPPGLTFDSGAEILLWNDPRARTVPVLEKANWKPEEWRELIEGELGPWAAVIVDSEIVSLCHSARLAQRAAEAGAWTDPDHRGHGHAAAATAAWASLLAPAGRLLFYSTSADNRSSQRVAARLNLRQIGWLWQLLPGA